MRKIALITGATSGIGQATAQLFAQNHWDVIITGRRKERLTDLANNLEDQFGVRVLSLAFDVRDHLAVSSRLNALPEEWKNVQVLVNNAGLAAGVTPIDEGHVQDWERMIDTNVKGMLYVTKAIVPLMKAQGGGHIINIGSIAGKETYKNGNVYCATKHAVEALSKGMRIDLLPYQIKVTNVCPGAVETEFSLVRYDGDAEQASAVYDGFDPLKAEDIAEVIWFAANRPAHVNLNDILIMPTAQANSTHLRRV